MSKTFKIVGNDMSDGYHTFDELYEHRVLLYLNLCVLMKDKVSYHLPGGYLNFCKDIFSEKHPEWDGHNSKMIADRLFINMKVVAQK